MENDATKALATSYERWITLEKAAEKLGCSKRTVERFIKAQLLATHKGKPAGARQMTRLVNPTEVAHLKHEIAVGNVNVDWKAIAANKTSLPAKQSRRVAVTDATLHRLPVFTAVSTDPWLTIEEAATYSRLPAAYLRRIIANDELDFRNVLDRTDRFSYRIKRSAIDELPAGSHNHDAHETKRYRNMGILSSPAGD